MLVANHRFWLPLLALVTGGRLEELGPLDVGFQTYWGWLVETGERRLFPELPATGKRTKEMSRWFGRAFRPSVGITDPSRTFHSFRHLFKDRCRAAKLRRDLHDSLTGHADGSAGAGYGDGLTLDDLKSGIDTLTFPGFPGVPARRGPFILAPERGAEIC
jgi:integrase